MEPAFDNIVGAEHLAQFKKADNTKKMIKID